MQTPPRCDPPPLALPEAVLPDAAPAGSHVWISKHGTIKQTRPIDQPSNLDAQGNRPASGAWRLGLKACQDVVKAAEAAGQSIVTVGSAWSLSDALRTRADGRIVETKFLNEIPIIGMDPAHLEPAALPLAGRLVFAQGGVTVAQAHEALATRALALPTSGASCGQTLAGACATGTHGAALAYGALPEMVRGVLMVIGGGEAVWIEPASRPVVNAAWCAAIGARLVRHDDDTFAASIVSFGTMGLVHAFLIEALPMYLLRGGANQEAKLSALFDGISRNGDQAVVNLPPSILPNGNAGLAHLSISIDPNPSGEWCVVSPLYAAGDAPDYVPHFSPAANPGVGDDALLDIATIMDGIGHVLGPFVNPTVKKKAAELLRKQAPLGQHDRTRALGEFFPRLDFPTGGNSTEIAVDVNDMKVAVRTVIKAIRAQPHAYPGIVSVRLVKGSSQLLAFTRFPVSCTIELPSANTNQSLPLFRAVWAALDAANVPYTLHWGQGSELTPDKVKKMWGAGNVARRKAARAALLGAHANTFRNVLSDAAGLT